MSRMHNIGRLTNAVFMIEEISTKNVKTIMKDIINLKNINIFIGPNNSCKSGLLDALMLYGQLPVVNLQVFGLKRPFSFRNPFYIREM